MRVVTPDPAQFRLLIAVFPPESDPLPWVTMPGHAWFCHSCDSNCHGHDLAYAHVTTRLLGRARITWQPHEWRHLLQDHGVDGDDLYEAETAIRGYLQRPGRAARFSPATSTLDLIDGRLRKFTP